MLSQDCFSMKNNKNGFLNSIDTFIDSCAIIHCRSICKLIEQQKLRGNIKSWICLSKRLLNFNTFRKDLFRTIFKMKLLCCLLTLMLAEPSLCGQKILNLPYDAEKGPEPCALTCSGVTKHSEVIDNKLVSWMGSALQAYRWIDVSDCGFVTAPVLTVTTSGPSVGSAMYRCPAVYIGHVDNEKFIVFTVGDASPSRLIANRCDVYWTANGFNCWAATIRRGWLSRVLFFIDI